MSYCVLCGVMISSRLSSEKCCLRCENLWQQLLLPASSQLRSIGKKNSQLVMSQYAYRSICRKTILAYKIGGFPVLGQYLAKLALQNELLAKSIQDCVCIMPAPSSFWSRCRDRSDLAACLAGEMAVQWGLPLISPPYRLCFRWQKQAHMTTRSRRQILLGEKARWNSSYFEKVLDVKSNISLPKVLIVDDVVTSGNTLLSMAQSFADVEFVLYAFASAQANVTLKA